MATAPNISVRLLETDDTQRLLDFELENRAWFDKWVGERPEGYYSLDNLQKINADLIAETAQDTAYMHLIIDTNDNIVGRINLSNIERNATGSANLGFRVAKSAVGKGIATQAIGIMTKIARADYDLDLLAAHCLQINVASATVLRQNGFQQTHISELELPWLTGTHKILNFERRLVDA